MVMTRIDQARRDAVHESRGAGADTRSAGAQVRRAAPRDTFALDAEVGNEMRIAAVEVIGDRKSVV